MAKNQENEKETQQESPSLTPEEALDKKISQAMDKMIGQLSLEECRILSSSQEDLNLGDHSNLLEKLGL
jgi:hypothetical protein